MTLKELAIVCLTEMPIEIIELNSNYKLVKTREYKNAEDMFTHSNKLENYDKFFDKKVKWFCEDLDRQVLKVRIY